MNERGLDGEKKRGMGRERPRKKECEGVHKVKRDRK